MKIGWIQFELESGQSDAFRPPARRPPPTARRPPPAARRQGVSHNTSRILYGRIKLIYTTNNNTTFIKRPFHTVFCVQRRFTKKDVHMTYHRYVSKMNMLTLTNVQLVKASNLRAHSNYCKTYLHKTERFMATYIWPLTLKDDLDLWPFTTQNMQLHEIHMHAKYQVAIFNIAKVFIKWAILATYIWPLTLKDDLDLDLSKDSKM